MEISLRVLVFALSVVFVYSENDSESKRFLAGTTSISIQNHCSQTVWAAMYGRLPGNSRWVAPNGGGWQLSPGQRVDIQVPSNLIAGRWWGRTNCGYSNGHFHCETGDCGPHLDCSTHHATGAPPCTLAELTLNAAGNQDFYDVSNVDGFNLPITLRPRNQQGNGQYWCEAPSCKTDLNPICPNELRYTVNGRTVGCRSACNKFNNAEYCCFGAHNRPETCNANTWGTNYPKFFKDHCPTAYSYAYDDHTSTFTCRATDYDVIFC